MLEVKKLQFHDRWKNAMTNFRLNLGFLFWKLQHFLPSEKWHRLPGHKQEVYTNPFCVSCAWNGEHVVFFSRKIYYEGKIVLFVGSICCSMKYGDSEWKCSRCFQNPKNSIWHVECKFQNPARNFLSVFFQLRSITFW